MKIQQLIRSYGDIPLNLSWEGGLFCHQSLVIAHWSLVVGYWSLVIGCWLLLVGYCLLVIFSRLLD
ncbi:MAG TPA: hypothetical protein DEP38_17175 [Cyanobacteria bacterium UBA9226]|nr:hypothetical protein [Cyanobacteria bacterium UBA9226]